ncbi:MAG TPA: replication-associated recombination protein A, partial [Hyphomonas sp.]|nr:replication-associated recombination protein A [Hyphomonas sp.]
YLLNMVEQVFAMMGEPGLLSVEEVTRGLQKRAPAYDKTGDGHYNLISALHKSVRGSDPDAALYWFARMIDGGEDPLYLARRLIRMASEDIGLADPTALMVASEAARAYERMGSPEGELALAHAVVHLATAPKSNAVYVAWKAALQSARETGSLMPPKHILNAPTKMMKQQGYGEGYAYDHDTEDGVSGQNYFPDGMKRETFYQPKGEGREKAIAERLAWIAKIRERKSGQ